MGVDGIVAVAAVGGYMEWVAAKGGVAAVSSVAGPDPWPAVQRALVVPVELDSAAAAVGVVQISRWSLVRTRKRNVSLISRQERN